MNQIFYFMVGDGINDGMTQRGEAAKGQNRNEAEFHIEENYSSSFAAGLESVPNKNEEEVSYTQSVSLILLSRQRRRRYSHRINDPRMEPDEQPETQLPRTTSLPMIRWDLNGGMIWPTTQELQNKKDKVLNDALLGASYG